MPILEAGDALPADRVAQRRFAVGVRQALHALTGLLDAVAPPSAFAAAFAGFPRLPLPFAAASFSFAFAFAFAFAFRAMRRHIQYLLAFAFPFAFPFAFAFAFAFPFRSMRRHIQCLRAFAFRSMRRHIQCLLAFALPSMRRHFQCLLAFALRASWVDHKAFAFPLSAAFAFPLAHRSMRGPTGSPRLALRRTRPVPDPASRASTLALTLCARSNLSRLLAAHTAGHRPLRQTASNPQKDQEDPHSLSLPLSARDPLLTNS